MGVGLDFDFDCYCCWRILLVLTKLESWKGRRNQ